jgi:hypothetical protein
LTNVTGLRIIYAMMRKKKMPEDVRSFFVAMGRKGGKIGGSSRAANMTPEERSEAARRAVQARWAKRKEGAA